MRKHVTLIIVLLGLGLIVSVSEARDLTFYVWSDTHVGRYGDDISGQSNIIDQMNDLAGKKYPDSSETKVKEPAFLLNLGDITELGLQSEWDLYEQIISGLRYPLAPEGDFHVCEVVGNHDCRESAAVKIAVSQKHWFSYYTFAEQGVHFFMLDAYKDMCTAGLDEDQLKWLRSEVDKLTRGTPIIIAMHPAPENLPYEDEEKLWDILHRKNVLVILHGHWHRVIHTRWKKFDVLAPAGFGYGSGTCTECHPIFGVMRITDSGMYCYSWHWSKGEFLPEASFVKSFVKGKSKKTRRSSRAIDSIPSVPVQARVGEVSESE